MHKTLERACRNNLDALYRTAVLAVRIRVEDETLPMDVDDALKEVIASYPLVLNQIAQLERETRNKYS